MSRWSVVERSAPSPCWPAWWCGTAPALLGQSDLAPEALDIDFGVVDILVGVESLDSSVADVESATAVQTTLAADVLFAFNRADLTPVASATLAQVANDIKNRAKGVVRIDGYTDSVGDDAYNLDLSRRRAAAVQTALQPLLAGAPVTLQVNGRVRPTPWPATPSRTAPTIQPAGQEPPG